MAANRQGALVITDETATKHTFAFDPTDNGIGYTMESRPWEPGDGAGRLRMPLHPWDGGLHHDRLDRRLRSYSKGNCDPSWQGMLLFPPAISGVVMANAVLPSKQIEFDSVVFFVSGRYMYYFDPATNTVTQDKDFGLGFAAVDFAVFNSELVVAMGETEKIWTRNLAGTWTQAADSTFAIALGVVDEKLWRAETTNRLSVATTAPRTLTSWTPASPNQYYAGDSTYAVNTIIDYGGIPWALKADGAYAPDSQSRFKNQTPQLRRTPNADNGKGAFIAWGALWLPSSSGLLRVTPGKSQKRGPEVSSRPSYRWWVRAGVEYGEAVYLLCTDESSVSSTVIIKMLRDEEGLSPKGEYLYHEWCRVFDSATKGYTIGVTSLATNPKLVCGFGNDMAFVVLGRGGGRDVDDANYSFGTAMALETGLIMGGEDLGIVADLVGVDTVLDYSRAGETLSVEYAVDRKKDTDAYDGTLLTTQEGGGTGPITLTTNYQRVTRYAPPNTSGQMFEFKFTGGLTSAAGTTRPVIREAYAILIPHPVNTDVITVAIKADINARVNGAAQGKSRSQIARYFRDWKSRGVILTASIEGYEEGRTTRVMVADVQEVNSMAIPGKNDTGSEQISRLKVALIRVDYAGAYATA